MKKEIIGFKVETSKEEKQECLYCHRKHKRIVLKASAWENQSVGPCQEDRNITVIKRCFNVRMEDNNENLIIHRA
jgi:hypothetical protein